MRARLLSIAHAGSVTARFRASLSAEALGLTGCHRQGGGVPEITVSVQAEPRDLDSWLTLARHLESAGFDGLLLGDHPGSGASPWPALGAAAAVTQTLTLGTYVAQAGVREPVHVAADAATLDILAPGRVLLGIGAGHTPREWDDIGRQRPAPAQRAERLAEFAEVIAGLLRGDTVTQEGRYLTLRGSRLDGLPAGGAVRLLVGGGHPQVLRVAARRAHVVGLSGLGRTLPDGHRHEARWSEADLRRQLDLVQDEAQRAGNAPALEALVQVVRVTQDRPAAIREISGRIAGASEDDVARTPFVLIGTYAEMAAQLSSQAGRYGISRYVIRESAVPDLEHVMSLLPAIHIAPDDLTDISFS
jgi:probable F420-dependent oxidoreductase